VSFINLGSWELVLIMVIAILAVGPKRMVEIVRTIQRWAAQARKLSRQLMNTLQTEIDAAEDLKATAEEAARAVDEVRRGVTDTVARAGASGDTLTETAREATAALSELKTDLEDVTRAHEDRAAEEEAETEG
jgi:sec-independent protein translocase protein TatB